MATPPGPCLVLAGLLLAGCSDSSAPPTAPVTVDRALGAGDDLGFARALAPRVFHFPADHGPHPDYRNEWWYLTGNLADDAGRRFGYQATFFRIALAPPAAAAPARGSAWATRQIWMVHAAVTDVQGGRHLARERLVRDALGLAGAQSGPFRVWAGNWRLYAEAGSDARPWRLQLAADAFALDLRLDALGAPVPQGDQGLSQKDAQPGNASYYYSIPRLATQGVLQVGDRRFTVQGLSWLDREWSTSALGPEQVGWDWFSLQLVDGTDLMYYRLRRKDGRSDPHSRGSALLPDGTRRDLRPGDLELRPLAEWRSGDGRHYPVDWSIQVRPLGRSLRVKALLPDQMMDLTVRYWEGAVEVREAGHSDPTGHGYLELAGY